MKSIIELAREARLAEPSHPFNPWGASNEALERFAALVRDDYLQELLAGSGEPWTYTETSPAKPLYTADQMAAAVLRERERCAKVCEEVSETYRGTEWGKQAEAIGDAIAAAIRGETK